MSTATVAAAVGVVVVVVIVGFFAFRPDATQAPTPMPSPAFEEVDSGSGLSVTESGEADEGAVQPSESTATDTSQAEAGEEVTISINDTGFTPDTVTIAAGTTVTFVNNGQGLHWPASDVHPTHEILSEFDANRGLATGETYSYTFTQVGTWRMHDHLKPSSTGAIIVE